MRASGWVVAAALLVCWCVTEWQLAKTVAVVTKTATELQRKVTEVEVLKRVVEEQREGMLSQWKSLEASRSLNEQCGSTAPKVLRKGRK